MANLEGRERERQIDKREETKKEGERNAGRRPLSESLGVRLPDQTDRGQRRMGGQTEVRGECEGRRGMGAERRQKRMRGEKRNERTERRQRRMRGETRNGRKERRQRRLRREKRNGRRGE